MCSDLCPYPISVLRSAPGMQNVISWWKSLSEVEKVSKSTIAQLMHSAEGIISEERLAWMSTAESAVSSVAAADKGDVEEAGIKKASADAALY